MPDLKDLQLTLDAGVPLLVIESWEEDRMLDLVRRVGFSRGLPVWGWTLTDGLRRLEIEGAAARKDLHDPKEALRYVRAQNDYGLFVFCDLHPFLRDDPEIVRLIKDIALAHARVPHTLMLLSHALELPPELQRHASRFRLSLPGDAQLTAIVREEAADWSRRNNGQRVRTDAKSLDALVRSLRGMTTADARRLVRGAIIDDGAITDSDVPAVNRAKVDLLARGGVLGFEYDTADFANVAGLARLKAWLAQRKTVFFGGQDAKIDAPRGILLTGVQGAGKSLAARAVAGNWGLPLLRFDFGALYNKFHGETERNLRESLKVAETVAPCVLWMDEIEKGIAVGDHDGGTSRRVLGTLLTWMAERKSPVFVVATANDIARLPAELVRKGRFDEVFFVDLPSAAMRAEIFRIHLVRRGQDVALFDLSRLAEVSDGHTGAEIEQAVVSALYGALARQQPLTTTHLVNAVEQTRPLSVTMAEQVQAVRDWARERAVSAD
ncbi:MAG: AAA family ATPase [Gammaproteobacteria bacterium]